MNIAQAVAPLKAQAIEAAAQYAVAYVERLMVRLEEAGWDLEIAAPTPRTNIGKAAYIQAKNKRNTMLSFTKEAGDRLICRRMGEPNIRVRNGEAITRFIEQTKQAAAAEFDAFVAKLNTKIGAHDDAILIEGANVWAHSILKVTKGQEIQKWKTQQILNISKLGNVFNQWPTRLVK